MPSTPTPPRDRLLLTFRGESMTTVSRKSVKAMAERLGFNETQTVLFALARLRDQVLGEPTSAVHEDYIPLSPAQAKKITAAAPVRRGKVISSLLP